MYEDEIIEESVEESVDDPVETSAEDAQNQQIISLLESINHNLDMINSELSSEAGTTAETIENGYDSLAASLDAISNNIVINTSAIGFVFGLLCIVFLFRIVGAKK